MKKDKGDPEDAGLRCRAEERLSREKRQAVPIPPEKDARRMVHELQVHQIELELQNEELKHARGELERQLEKYSDLYNFAPVGYFTLDREGTILEANLTGARLLGTERSRLAGRRLNSFMTDKSYHVFDGFLKGLYGGRAGQTCEAALLTPEDRPRYVQIEGAPVESDGGAGRQCRAAMIDITLRRQAEEALHRYELLSRNSRDIVLFMRRDNGSILEANAAAETAYGYSRDELLKLTINDLRAAGTWGQTAAQMAQADAEGILFETIHRRKDGGAFPVEVSSQGATIEGTRTLISVVRDITERKRAESRALKEIAYKDFLLQLNEKSHALSDKELYDYVLEETVRLTDSAIGFFHLVSDDRKDVILTTWNREALKDCTADGQGHYPMERAGNWVDCVRLGRPVIYNDFPNSPNQKGLPRGHVPVRRFLSVPIMEGAKVRAILGVGNKEKEYDEFDMVQVQVVASAMHAIMRQRQAEKALRKNRDRIASVLDSITDRYVAYDHDWRFLEVNREAEHLFDRRASELVGRRLFDLYPKVEQSDVVAHYRRAVAEGKPVHFESRSPVSGEWSEIHAYPQPDGLEVYAKNINERKEAEEALREARDELELRVRERTSELEQAQGKLIEQSRILESFFTSTITPLVFLDKAFNFIRVNAAFAKACGREMGEFPGCNYFGFYPHEETEAVFRQVVVTKIPYQASAQSFIFPDHPEWGTTYWDYTLTPLLNEAGEVEFLVFSLKDVTDKERAEQQLRQAQKMEAIGTLAGGIAHDFNNMLAVIIGNAELALGQPGGKAGPRRNVEQIFNAARRASDLVKQILMFSRKTEEGKIALKLTPLVKETCKLLRGSLPSTIHMKLDLRTTFCAVMGDPSQIQQVLMNLCINAAHAMREKGGTLSISIADVAFAPLDTKPVADMEPGSYVRLSVRDTGTGMTEDVQKRMFEPFFTTKEVGQGTGMGLAAVYGIVKSHGGLISVRSKAGVGSTFTIFFPCADAAPKEIREETGPLPGGKERILFVDDEPAIVEMASYMLGRLGYDVTSMSSGVDALKAFLKGPGLFDLVITDQTMPDLTGIDLAQRMREKRKDVPIVLITGYSETVSPEKAEALGISELVMKPFVAREMAETIRAVLDRGSENR